MSSFDPMNPTSFNYGTPGQNNSWGQPRQYVAQPQYRLNSNIIFVTSLEEALAKTIERPSDMMYFHQDKNEFYRVKVDADGRKSWATFPYNSPDPDENTPATKADIQGLVARIEALEAQKETKSVTKKKKEVIDNAESNGHGQVFDFSNS